MISLCLRDIEKSQWITASTACELCWWGAVAIGSRLYLYLVPLFQDVVSVNDFIRKKSQYTIVVLLIVFFLFFKQNLVFKFMIKAVFQSFLSGFFVFPTLQEIH